MTTDLPPTSPRPTNLECGERFHPTSDGPLTVTGHFPGAVSTGEQMVKGTVEVAAKRSPARGVVTPLAETFLVREGRIVTMPMPQDAVGRSLDLTEGSVERMPAIATLVPCSGGDALARGTYELYVRVVLNNEDGTRADSLGGPYPFEVR